MPAMKITAVTLIPLLAVSILAGPIARTTLAPAKRADVQDIVARQRMLSNDPFLHAPYAESGRSEQ